MQTVEALPNLYEADETAWLEAMADLIARGKNDELDFPHLREYLTDMAKRDRREVKNRLAVLIAHLLKWTFQKGKRSRSWRLTMLSQRQRLEGMIDSGVLRNHANEVLALAYRDAVKRAVIQTGLPKSAFPRKCPYTLEMLLADDLPEA